MCGRVTQYRKIQEIADATAAKWNEQVGQSHRPRYNASPQSAIVILRRHAEERVLERAVWAVERHVGPGKTKMLFNTKVESIQKATWKRAFQERRCVLPVDGFYEWTGDKKHRVPFHFQRSDSGLLLIAGIFDEAPPATEEEPRPLPGFSVITTTANGLMSKFHDRMPCILTLEEADRWLHEPSLDLLRPVADDVLRASQASTLVNARHDGPDCLEPDEPLILVS